MAYKIDVGTLISNLRSVKDESADPSVFPLEGSGDGIKYLAERVLFPTMNNVVVDSGDLDFEMFTREDISELCSIYLKKFDYHSVSFQRLKGIYDTLCYSRPDVNSVSFI